ncbi:MAG: YibE/F family protein [Treponema sp.]|jgi:uncharacterized membrane protein|nr:YibE/F family protein [Treponema sp.]
MKIKIPYLLTVIISILLIFLGHKIAVNDLFDFQAFSPEVVSAKVQSVIERVSPDDGLGGFMPMLGDKIIFEAIITNGERKGEVVTAAQNFSGYSRVTAKETGKGDSVLLINMNDEWYFNGYIRTNKLMGLGILFILCLLIFGGKKGFNTVLSLALTCGAVFAVFIPSILSGKNIYIMSILVCAYTIIMTLLIVIGFNKKSLAAATGCLGGLGVSGIITVIMDKVLLLTGIVDEHSRYLANLPVENPINLRAIIFAGIIIGAMGAVEDVATSLASSLWEIKEKAEKIKFETLFRSGLTIGRDIMGSMANTLILAYIGSSLSAVLILSVYSGSLFALFNMEMIVVEILQALIGSLGILFAMPLTAFFCSVFYLKKTIVQT